MATNIGKIGSAIQSYLQQANKPSAIQPATPTTGSTVGSGLSSIANLAGKVLGAAVQNPSAGALVNPYNIGQYNAINQGYTAQLDALNKGTEQYITTLNNGADGANAALDNARSSAIDQIQRTYDDSARNYYRLYKRNEKDLPEQLSSVGATGGASESAALALMNKYSDNMYKNEYGRNQQISGVNEDYYNAVAKNSQQLAQQIASAYLNLAQSQAQLEGQKADSMGNLWNNMYSQYQANKQAEADALAKQQEADAAASLTARNNKVRENEAQRLRQGYTTMHWTDSDGAYHYQITGQKKSSSKSSGSKYGGSGSGSSKSGGSGSGSDENTVLQISYDDAYRNALANMYGNSTYGMKTAGASDALAYLKKLNTSGTLSDENTLSIIKKLGLN